MQTDKPRVRQSDLLSEEVNGQYVIYDNHNQAVHGLNGTMSWLWSHCDGSRTLDDLIARHTIPYVGADASVAGEPADRSTNRRLL
jgi:hypothetical protein